MEQTAKWAEKQGQRGLGKSREEVKREEAECVAPCTWWQSRTAALLRGSAAADACVCVCVLTAARMRNEITQIASQLNVIRQARLRKLYEAEAAQCVSLPCGRARTRRLLCGARQCADLRCCFPVRHRWERELNARGLALAKDLL